MKITCTRKDTRPVHLHILTKFKEMFEGNSVETDRVTVPEQAKLTQLLERDHVAISGSAEVVRFKNFVDTVTVGTFDPCPEAEVDPEAEKLAAEKLAAEKAEAEKAEAEKLAAEKFENDTPSLKELLEKAANLQFDEVDFESKEEASELLNSKAVKVDHLNEVLTSVKAEPVGNKADKAAAVVSHFFSE